MRVRRLYLFAVLLTACVIRVQPAWGQGTQALTLQQAEQIAIQNHPQIQAATATRLPGRGTGGGDTFHLFPASEWEPDRRRCGNQQPHRRGVLEQSSHL